MESLPDPVLRKLQTVVTILDDGLQERTHKVDAARRIDRAFRRRSFTEDPLRRSLLCDILVASGTPGVRVDELGNGGCELSIVHGGVERRFRLKKASVGRYNQLVVTASSDSILTPQARRARQATLWDEFEPDTCEPEPEQFQQWVLAYLLHPQTRTFTAVTAGRVVDVKGRRSPFKLVLDDLVHFAVTPAPAVQFVGDDDDLDLGEGDVAGEDAG